MKKTNVTKETKRTKATSLYAGQVVLESTAYDYLVNARVKVGTKEIPRGNYSLRQLAMIDCLINYHGYHWVNMQVLA